MDSSSLPVRYPDGFGFDAKPSAPLSLCEYAATARDPMVVPIVLISPAAASNQRLCRVCASPFSMLKTAKSCACCGYGICAGCSSTTGAHFSSALTTTGTVTSNRCCKNCYQHWVGASSPHCVRRMLNILSAGKLRVNAITVFEPESLKL